MPKRARISAAEIEAEADVASRILENKVTKGMMERKLQVRGTSHALSNHVDALERALGEVPRPPEEGGRGAPYACPPEPRPP